MSVSYELGIKWKYQQPFRLGVQKKVSFVTAKYAIETAEALWKYKNNESICQPTCYASLYLTAKFDYHSDWANTARIPTQNTPMLLPRHGTSRRLHAAYGFLIQCVAENIQCVHFKTQRKFYFVIL
jgi:hypothetical protein